jgi:membrane-bound serine protease (ClpP class)
LAIDTIVDQELAEIADPNAEIPQQQLVEGVTVRFQKLSLVDQLFHTVASPAVAYLLLLIGLSMILLEFYTAGIGVAGVTGAICLLLSSYGMGVLSIRPWALVVLVLSMLAFAVDVQTGVPRFWTGVGTLCLLVGSLFVFDEHGMSWLPLVIGVVLTLAFVLSGMPSLVRSRFSTTTIGREWMIGEMGVAISDIDPDGTVEVRGAQWRARTNRLTPLTAGAPARVTAIEGTILEVEPETGGAIDYREMRHSSD